MLVDGDALPAGEERAGAYERLTAMEIAREGIHLHGKGGGR